MANYYAQKKDSSKTLLGLMVKPDALSQNVNITFSFANLQNTATDYHTFLFNFNAPNASTSFTIRYFDSLNAILQTDTVSVNQTVGDYIYQLHHGQILKAGVGLKTYTRIDILLNLNTANIQTTNVVGLLKTIAPVTPENLVCFAENSMVFTPNGEVPIQNLKKGDLVYDEYLNVHTVDYVAKRTVFPSASLNKYSLPVEIKQNSLDENVPNKDTIVSSAHLIKHNGQMVPASELGSVYNMESMITYYNVSIKSYGTMIVNGMVSETLDISTDSKVYEKVY